MHWPKTFKKRWHMGPLELTWFNMKLNLHWISTTYPNWIESLIYIRSHLNCSIFSPQEKFIFRFQFTKNYPNLGQPWLDRHMASVSGPFLYQSKLRTSEQPQMKVPLKKITISDLEMKGPNQFSQWCPQRPEQPCLFRNSTNVGGTKTFRRQALFQCLLM